MQIKLKYNKMNKRFETIEEMLDMKNMFVSPAPVEDKLENYIGKPIRWRYSEYDLDIFGWDKNYDPIFVPTHIEQDCGEGEYLLWDENCKWCDLEYAQKNVLKEGETIIISGEEGSDERY